MRKTLNSLLLLTCIICTTTASFAQFIDNDYRILFKSGEITFPANVDEFIAQPNLSDEANEKYLYRLMQFKNIPTVSVQNQLDLMGILLLEYLPHKAYIVAIPTHFNHQLLKNFGIRSIVKVPTQAKMDEYLRNEVYPNWATEGEQVKLFVKLNHHSSISEIIATLEANDIEVLNYYYRSALLKLKIKQSATAIQELAEYPFVNYVETVPAPGEKEDIDGNSLNRSNTLKTNGLNYDGTGINIQTRDDGAVGPHIDFEGRIEMVMTSSTGTHGDGVAGIFGGAGNLNPYNSGGASGSFMYVTDYDPTFQDTTYGLHLYRGMKVTNSSYSQGCNAGYTTTTQTVDDQIYSSPTLMHVFSAGNSGTSDCQYGAGNLWGNITGGHKIGKNVITAANLNRNSLLETSSSRGPSEDGRLKPDLAAHGAGQISTAPDNAYMSFGGTSAAAPSMAGVVAQLMHAYKDLNGGQEPKSGLIKAAALNTANDLGNIGPDFKFGWGLINARKAYNLLAENRYLTGTIGQGTTNAHTITIPADVKEARIMVYWMDPAASPAAAKALINDLNMSVTGAGNTSLPLILDHTPNAVTLDNPAVPGVDSMNNVEQVRLDNPTAGTYTVNVAGATVPLGAKEYYVLYEFITNDITITYPAGGEGIVPSETARIHWEVPNLTGQFTLDYSLDDGQTWVNIGNATANDKFLDWAVPSVFSDEARVRITRGNVSDVSEMFTIIGRPTNLTVDSVCTTELYVSWDSVPNATSYDVFVLGNKYMDSVSTSTITNGIIPITDPDTNYWIAVRANYNTGTGERTNAIPYNGGLQNCALPYNMELAILEPYFGSCNTAADVVVSLENQGYYDVSGLIVHYQLNNNAIISDTITSNFTSGQVLNHTFSTPLNLVSQTINDLTAWITYPADLNNNNDTVQVLVGAANVTHTGLYSDDFESFNSCSTTSDCELTTCNLTNGWFNLPNGNHDDIDWRVDNGGTPSAGTGPSSDFNPGTNNGNYLYLEASGGCTGQTAILKSPCLDLSNLTIPYLKLGYHMFGGQMGSLHIDVFHNGIWTYDIIQPISGNIGNTWSVLTVDLSAYAGSTIQIGIRGVTGDGFESDLAIDDFNILELNTPPVAQFSSNDSLTCPSAPLSFFDESDTLVTNRKWNFTPNTVTFLNGTTDSSINPIVQFNAVGSYDVQLIATNLLGQDTLILSNFITVSGGMTLPITEDFQSFGNCGTASDCEIEVCELGNGWKNESNINSDNIDWRVDQNGTPSGGTGPSFDHTIGNSTGKYIYLEASGGCTFQEASLVSPCIDLSGTTYPFFSLWYHMNGSDMGELHIDLLDSTGWNNDIISPVVGNQGNSWEELNFSLASYIGQTIVLRIRGITGSNFESDIALDDINIFNLTSITANMNIDGDCYDNMTFSDNSSAGATSWAWDFGANATPATATGIGPHSVAFSSAANQNVQLIVTSPVGNDTVVQTASLDTIPTAIFTYVPANEVLTFTNNSIGTGNFLWNFGDGTSSSAQNPAHTYTTSGIFTVSLTITNVCGSNTFTEQIEVIVTDVNKISDNWSIDLFPNPNKGQFQLQLEGVRGDIQMTMIDMQGRLIKNWNYANINNGWTTKIDAGDLASGIYIVKITTNNGVKNVKLLIE